MSARIVNMTNPDVESELADSLQGALSTVQKMIETTLEQGGDVQITLRNRDGELLGVYRVEVG